jgi:uncharacterized protein involved in exopolysaccharide biosynthesis/Mrp family chromosome partitioning ATPase
MLALNSILFAATIAVYLVSPRVWTASTQLILPNTTTNLDASLGTLGNLKDTSIDFSNEVNPLKTQASIITSKDVLVTVWASDPEKSQFQSLDSYSKLFKAKPVDQSTTIWVEVNASHPDLALQRANTLVKVYHQRLDELRKDEAVAREQFTTTEVERTHQNLRQAQMALAAFKESSGLINSEEQTKGIVSTIATLTEVQSQALAQAQSNETLAKTLSARLGLSPDQAIKSLGLGENQDYQFTRQKLSEVEATLVETRSRFVDGHPMVQTLLAQRDQLRSQIEQSIAQAATNTVGVDTTVGSTSSDQGRVALIQRLVIAESEHKAQQRQAAQLQSQVDKLSAGLKSIPVSQGRVLELQRQYDIAEGVYKGLIAQVQQAKVSAFNSYPNVQLLDRPAVDPKPTSPKRSFIALGGILTSVFGSLALVLFLESHNPLLKPKDLQDMELPSLVRIPRLKQPAMELDLNSETEVEFQRLASAISLMPLEKRRLMVSSSTVEEGKTTVTLGLAMALIDLGFRVLVVDGDFRKAELSRRLGYSHRATLQQRSTTVQVRPKLDLMPTTPRQHGKIVEFVARGGFEQELSAIQASGDYDYVIVDTAPVGLTSETALMTAAVPNVLLVVRLGISDRNLVYDSLEQLTRHNALIAGLAINYVERTEGYLYRHENSQINA